MAENNANTSVKGYAIGLLGIIPCLMIYFPKILHRIFFVYSSAHTLSDLPLWITILQNSLYGFISGTLLILFYCYRAPYQLSFEDVKKLLSIAAVGVLITFCFEVGFLVLPYQILKAHGLLSTRQMLFEMGAHLKAHAVQFLPLLVFALLLGVLRQIIQRKSFDETDNSHETSGKFGSATWATPKDFKQLNAYQHNNGIFIGTDGSGKTLYLPLCNKLTISPPGGGKTTASSIPLLLSHKGPVFVFDIRGELWATTARYRAQTLGRHVIVIDPFGVTKGPDFQQGKPEWLLKTSTLNPFDWIPNDQKQRDRMINAFAASFVINEGGFARHFDENAKILIRGYIDYIMTSKPANERGLPMLYQCLSESLEEAKMTFAQMGALHGRASAAANQISRVGADERGSILSTSYRQMDWMGDSNIQTTLASSNFNLTEFLAGNMDVFVVLPEDQVKEHNRLVRMILALLMSQIVQANPSDLPKQKIVFLLEELAQLGYCPDVEQCIEVLRARGVVVWTVFQTLSQIELFEKPDLFKGAPLKQIFTNDDTKTMEWIQTLGGKRTILTKTLSTNSGDSRQKMQTFGGTLSRGEGESIHETGVDLIALNEIRELPRDEQFVFLHSAKPMRCKKVRYFEPVDFKGKFDENPLEKRG
jgi:type IV secretory pathway TraG/TraD family ATPase VirD4